MFGCIFENCWCEIPLLFVALYFLLNFIVDKFTIPDGAGKKILITGCDSGFGYATALKLNEGNCKVFAGCLTQDGVDTLQNDNSFQGIAFIMDVTKDEDVEKAKKFIEDNGGLDGVVNNAGIANGGLFEWMSMEQMKKVVDVNYWGTVRTTKAMLSLLKKSRGRVVNVTSIGGRLAIPYLSSYCSSKFATEAFSDCLRLEMKPWGVSVHIIEPTYHRTNLSTKERSLQAWDNIYNAQPLEVKEEIPQEKLRAFVAKKYDSVPFTESIDGVINNIKHALLSYVPRRRYVPGRRSMFMVFLTHLPTVVQDLIFNSKPKLGPDARTKNKKSD